MADKVSGACLYTSVKNISGRERVFGFLGVRGMRLGIDETVTVRGDLVAKLGATTSARRFQALERALTGDNGQRDPSLQILSTPAVILTDGDDAYALSFKGGVLGVIDPCWTWGESGSSDFISA